MTSDVSSFQELTNSPPCTSKNDSISCFGTEKPLNTFGSSRDDAGIEQNGGNHDSLGDRIVTRRRLRNKPIVARRSRYQLDTDLQDDRRQQTPHQERFIDAKALTALAYSQDPNSPHGGKAFGAKRIFSCCVDGDSRRRLKQAAARTGLRR